MSRAVILLVAIACLSQAAARPVRRTLNFNMFLLQPNKGASDRLFITTDGVSRFGPLLEYFIQRVQGMMSVRLPQQQANELTHDQGVPIGDTAENEVDAGPESRMPGSAGIPGVVVRPSKTKPGTYEVEINVVVDDGQPETYNSKKTNGSTNN